MQSQTPPCAATSILRCLTRQASLTAVALDRQMSESTPLRISRQRILPPVNRRLRGFALDPGLGTSFDTALLNEMTLQVPWEADLQPGPAGEYIEVIDIDYDGTMLAPVDLNQRELLAQDGLTPSDGNLQFHQQMVYAVAMRTIQNFERALGRV